jgi:hypothetical protein
MSDKYIKADGFNSAIVGVDTDACRVVYSKQKMIECLVLDEGWSLEDAIEYLQYNVWGAYINEYTPLYLEDYDVMFES